MEVKSLANEGGLSYFVNIENIDSTMAFLRKSDKKMYKALRKGLRKSAQPLLQSARANATAIMDDGTMRDSLRISIRANGTVLLRSTDEAAKVKEFANRGARYTPKKTDKRRNARTMNSFPVGVPRGNPPRVMIKAINDNQEQFISSIQQTLEDTLKEVEHG